MRKGFLKSESGSKKKIEKEAREIKTTVSQNGGVQKRTKTGLLEKTLSAKV